MTGQINIPGMGGRRRAQVEATPPGRDLCLSSDGPERGRLSWRRLAWRHGNSVDWLRPDNHGFFTPTCWL